MNTLFQNLLRDASVCQKFHKLHFFRQVNIPSLCVLLVNRSDHQFIAEEKLIPFELAVLPVPQFDPEHPQMISQGPSICIFNKEDPQEVLYSWLFTQYLLTDGIQIAYSQTEGYVPVTTSAQESPEYQDYLARAGEDNDTYYQVKIDAAKLQHAKRLLAGGELIKNVAERTGFASPSAFILFFKRNTGKTPRQFFEERTTTPMSAASKEAEEEQKLRANGGDEG